MPISWNEIRHNAIKFSGEWKGARCERADSQTFWNEFFQVFGIKRRVVASFEEPARRISGTYGFIDMFWRGVLIVEQKSFGEDLGKAKAQAFNYIHDLANEGRHAEIPRYLIVSDFARVALHDLEPEEQRDLRSSTNGAARPLNFRSPIFTDTSTPSPSFPATSSTPKRQVFIPMPVEIKRVIVH
jgi:hypothetical protein